MCIDYRALNSQTIKNRYVLSRIDDLLDQLHEIKWFSKIDLTNDYWQIAIIIIDRYKIVFRIRYDHYEFNIMPFDLTNALTMFQSLINNIFRDMLDIYMIIYLDDILIYSKNDEDHEKYMRQVLQRLREYKLYVRLLKCIFFIDIIEYLEYIIEPDDIRSNRYLSKLLSIFHSLICSRNYNLFLVLQIIITNSSRNTIRLLCH